MIAALLTFAPLLVAYVWFVREVEKPGAREVHAVRPATELTKAITVAIAAFSDGLRAATFKAEAFFEGLRAAAASEAAARAHRKPRR